MPWHTLLYTLGLVCGALLGSPAWLAWLLVSPKTRAGFWEKLGFYSDEFLVALDKLNRQKSTVWLHAVSVGEFNAVRPLIEQLLQQDVQLVVSTTTKTGQELAKKILSSKGIPVFYCPFDFPTVIQRALMRISPDMLVIVETELWPNLTDQVTRWWKKPLVLINGRLSQQSFQSYKRVKPFIKPMLEQMTACYMQDTNSAKRLLELGADTEKLETLGNVKFDIKREQPQEKTESLREMFGFSETDRVVTFASTHAGEDELFAEAFIQLRKTFPKLRMVLAPRHPERCDAVRKILNNRALRYSLRSELNEHVQNSQPIVVLDTIGELQAVYGLSQLAVIGGSFVPVGGHNPLEPIASNLPVLFGPHMFNFPEISRLILEAKAGCQVQDEEALIHQLTVFLTQPEKAQIMADSGQLLLDKHQGVTAKLCEKLLTHLHDVPED